MTIQPGMMVPARHRPNRLILHVGPPKTGTSILQHTLDENRASLIKQGFLYPSLRPGPASEWSADQGEPTGVKHDYLLLLALQDPSDTLVYRRFDLSNENSLRRLQQTCLDSFQEELDTYQTKSIILSTESFGNLAVNPTTGMDELAGYVQELADEVVVVLYVRHPIAMARSRQQHLLRSGMNTLDELDTPWIYPYGIALERLWRLFGRSFVHAVAYERDFNREFDTVGSFGDLVGIETADWVRPPSRGNVGLSMEGALIADALTREYPQPDAMAGKTHPGRAHIDLAGSIVGGPFRLSDKTEDAVMERSSSDLLMLADEYDINFPDLPSIDQPLWGPESVRSAALLMNRLACRTT